MRKLDLGQTISIFANLGVIFGIILLVVELRQNNDLLEAQARAAVLDRRTAINELLASNSELAEIFAKTTEGTPLTAAEAMRLDAYNRRILASFEWQFGEYQRGRLELNLGGWRYGYHRADHGNTMADTWNDWRKSAPEDFVGFFEQNVVNHPLE